MLGITALVLVTAFQATVETVFLVWRRDPDTWFRLHHVISIAWDPMKNLEHHVNWHHFMNYKSLDTVLKINVFTACCSDYVWYVRATWVSREVASFFSLTTGTEGVEITNKFFLQSCTFVNCSSVWKFVRGVWNPLNPPGATGLSKRNFG